MSDTPNEVESLGAFKELAALAEKAEMTAFLKASREDIETGRTLPAREFLESLGKSKT